MAEHRVIDQALLAAEIAAVEGHPDVVTGRRLPVRRLALHEQVRILRLLVERINVVPDGISVTLHAAGLRSLVAELTADGAAEGLMLEAAE